MSTAAPEPEDDAEADSEDSALRPEDWSALSSRISEVKEAEEELEIGDEVQAEKDRAQAECREKMARGKYQTT